MKYCNDCKNQVVMHAFSFSNCKICGEEISTPHLPSYVLCYDCAGDDKCIQCGDKIDKDE